MFLCAFAWLMLTQFVAYQTEKKVRHAIQTFHLPSLHIYVEQLSYQRHFLGSAFQLRLRSDDERLDSVVRHWKLHADVKHGPLIFNRDNVQLAFARISMHLDVAQLDLDSRELVTRVFQDAVPFQADFLIDYHHRTHYKLLSGAMHYQVADLSISLSGGTATGVFSSDPVAADRGIIVHFDKIALQQGGFSVQALQNTLNISLAGNATDSLEPKLSTTLMQTAAEDYEQLRLALMPHEFSSFLEMFEDYEERYRLDQQIDWTLELAAQNQEGQDRLIALYQQQSAIRLPKADSILSQLLEQNPGMISYANKVEHANSLAYNSVNR